MVRLNKKTERFIKAQAAHYRNFYNQPCPEADAVVSELREAANKAPKNMTKEEEIQYILEQADTSHDAQCRREMLERVSEEARAISVVIETIECDVTEIASLCIDTGSDCLNLPDNLFTKDEILDRLNEYHSALCNIPYVV